MLGRTFNDAEGVTGGPEVDVLSEQLWKTAFHADPNIVGRSAKIGGRMRTVVGVMPQSFHFFQADGIVHRKGVWLPLQPTSEMLYDRGYHFFMVIGKLRSGQPRTDRTRSWMPLPPHPKEGQPKQIHIRTFFLPGAADGPDTATAVCAVQARSRWFC